MDYLVRSDISWLLASFRTESRVVETTALIYIHVDRVFSLVVTSGFSEQELRNANAPKTRISSLIEKQFFWMAIYLRAV
jgi:hypothetical protein